MELAELRVYHFNKGSSLSPAAFSQNASHFDLQKKFSSIFKIPSFYFETCQRWIWITLEKNHAFFSSSLQDFPTEIESFSGEAAYLFLLRVATGLESVIIGETDVFGQFKEAWTRFQAHSSDPSGVQLTEQLASQLAPWMRSLFEDTKEIRKNYLQKVGGASYGSLVRKWLKASSKDLNTGPILLVGAGKIAHSIAPFLLDFELWLTNRNLERSQYLIDQLKQKTSSSPNRLKLLEHAADGWRSAAGIISCIPFDPEGDLERCHWFAEGIHDRPILHLGGLRTDAGHWTRFPQFSCLNEIFDMQEKCQQFRTAQVLQAIQACKELTALRTLGATSTLTQKSHPSLRLALGGLEN